MKKPARLALASAGALAAALVSSATTASAAVTTIALPDLVERDASSSLVIANTGQTYAGDGYVAMRSSGEFIHAFTLEYGPTYATKDLLQADLSALAGATINSATLSFVILDTGPARFDMTATGFAGTGSVGYQFAAPGLTFGSVTGGVGQGANSLDVTAIVANAVGADAGWLNLLLEAGGCCAVTLTDGLSIGAGRGPDAALLRLTVDYTAAAPGGVPEPGTWALLLMGFAGLGGVMRARRAGVRAG